MRQLLGAARGLAIFVHGQVVPAPDPTVVPNALAARPGRAGLRGKDGRSLVWLSPARGGEWRRRQDCHTPVAAAATSPAWSSPLTGRRTTELTSLAVIKGVTYQDRCGRSWRLLAPCRPHISRQPIWAAGCTNSGLRVQLKYRVHDVLDSILVHAVEPSEEYGWSSQLAPYRVPNQQHRREQLAPNTVRQRIAIAEQFEHRLCGQRIGGLCLDRWRYSPAGPCPIRSDGRSRGGWRHPGAGRAGPRNSRRIFAKARRGLPARPPRP